MKCKFVWQWQYCSKARDWAYEHARDAMVHRFLMLRPSRTHPSRRSKSKVLTTATRTKISNNRLRYGLENLPFKMDYYQTRPHIGVFRKLSKYIPKKV